MLPVDLCFTHDVFFLLLPHSFYNVCTDLSTVRCVNTVDEKVPMAKNLGNFGQATLP